MAISAVGTLTTTSGSGITAKSITSATAGNLIVLYTLILSNARTVSSITGGTADAGGWTKLCSQISTGGTTIEMWWAKVGTPGTANATINWSSSTAGMFTIFGSREFTNGTGASTIWQADGAGAGQNNASSTTCAFPPLTASAAGRLYVGYGVGGSSVLGSGGTPAGTTFQIDPNDNSFCYNPTVSGLISPVTSASAGAQTSFSMGGLLAVALTLVPVTDAGTGSEALALVPTITPTDTGTGAEALAVVRQSSIAEAGTATDAVALVEQRSLTDTATGTEALDVQDIVHVALADGGTGSESIFVDIPVLKSATDTGTGSEALALAPVANASDSGTGALAVSIAGVFTLADSGTGSDTLTLLRQATVPDTATGAEAFVINAAQNLNDGGVGTEAFDILRSSAVVDGGTGSEAVASGPSVVDGGTGNMFLDLVIIPFTQVLPLKLGPVYDLVVVARIPQVSGSPTFLEVDPIEWKKLTYSNTLSQAQELSASCQISSLTETVLQRLRDLDTLATELWLYRNGKVVFAGPVVGYQTAGEDLTITCKGLLYYFRYMAITADLDFAQADQFVIVKTMVDQWQNLEYGNFGVDTSGVATSGVLRDAKYLATELHNVGQRVEDLGKLAAGFDSEVDPATRKLQLWNPIKGVDRSSGEDAIVLDSRNITSGDILCSVAVGDLASDAIVTSSPQGADHPLTATWANDELRKKFGRTVITQSFSDVADQPTLDSYAQALVEARNNALLVPGPKARVTPDADLAAYAVGDRIAYELSAVLSVSGSFRIRKQTINVGSTGSESVDLEFV